MDNRWILREQLEIVICLRSMESFLFFWGAEMVLFGLYWYNLSEMMMISEEFLVQNLSLQESDIDEYISPSCVKLESKLMVQDILEEE